MNSSRAIAFSLSGTIVLCLWLHSRLAREPAPHPALGDSSGQKPHDQDPTPSPQRGVHLRQVYPATNDPEQEVPDTDIDIIAIHGFDTNSDKTWTWEDRKDPKIRVNWLQDPAMLPSKVERARIFTCDWSADLLQPSDLVQKTEGEFALLLLEDIRRGLQMSGHASGEHRPILFIASCLGGIILMKAPVGAQKNTRQ